MIDTYIINLERHEQRKKDLIENITTNKIDNFLNIKFVTGIDGMKLTDKEKSEIKICPLWYDRNLKAGITMGEVGCALSHYKAWNEFYNSGNSEAIFLEDDVYFKKDNLEENLSYFKNYPPDADLVYILRKSLFNEDKFDNNNDKYFQEIYASYWLCGYLLTKKGVEKIMQSNFLENLIVVDEFLPLLYDNNYLQMYKKYYNITLKAYGLKKEHCFIDLKKNAFNDSSTFHSNYFEFDSSIIAIISDKNTSYSSISRFNKTCNKYLIQIKVINFEDIHDTLSKIDDNKYIILVNCNYCFFVSNPLIMIINDEKDFYYSSFSDFDNLLENNESKQLYFFGKKNIISEILMDSKNSYVNCDKINIVYDLDMNTEQIQEKNAIIINGINNKRLLCKYENYVIKKNLNSYGYKVINKKENYNFKIRLNIMIYEYKSIECINFLNTLDYPKEYLDINIYTNHILTINDNKIKINKMSEIEAFKHIYDYYFNYDYIWIIYSNNIITEPSILKDCLDTDKMVISCISLKKNSIFSNFWGSITQKGWYSRSDDYIDIVNRKKLNIWNVPFVNLNILINTKIFKKYNLFADTTFTDLDMIICHNLRNYNEGIYLNNQKLYGYILSEEKDTLNTITYRDKNIMNLTEEYIFSPEYLKFYNSNDISILKEFEKGSDIWYFPFFTPDFCDYIVNIAESNGNWSGGIKTKGTIDKRIGVVENIPTQDIHLKDIGLEPFWLTIINNHFKKIMYTLYNYKTKNYNIAFIVKYDAENGQTSLQPHHDSSTYTTNIALSNGTDYEDGGVKFHKKNIIVHNKNKGYICIHPGKITHYHEALPITKGKRYVLVSFNN